MPKQQLNDLGVQVRLCLNCARPFIVMTGSRKVFCSARCRNTFKSRLRRKRKRERDPEYARASLERLLRWKEAHKKPARSDNLAGENQNERSDTR